jgi:hypothetical protein
LAAVGDEGGFAPTSGGTEDAFDTIKKLLKLPAILLRRDNDRFRLCGRILCQRKILLL